MKQANQAPREFTSIAAWKAHYLPKHAEVEQEARAPFEDAIRARVIDILVTKITGNTVSG